MERFHQTLKKWLRTQRPARTVRELQAQLDAFRTYDNTIRPHRALARRTPAQAFIGPDARPAASPTSPGVNTHHWRTRQDRIDKSGIVTLRHNSRLHHLGVGRAHAGTKVLILVKDLNVRIITQDGELLRELVLDPAKDYQKQAKP